MIVCPSHIRTHIEHQLRNQFKVSMLHKILTISKVRILYMLTITRSNNKSEATNTIDKTTDLVLDGKILNKINT